MKIVVVFYQGKEVTRVKSDEIILMGNGFKLLIEGKEVARFLNDYDYAIDKSFVFEIKGSDLLGIFNSTLDRKNI